VAGEPAILGTFKPKCGFPESPRQEEKDAKEEAKTKYKIRDSTEQE
jgi:hypothetical protein